MRLAAFEMMSLMLICDSQIVYIAIVHMPLTSRYIVAHIVLLELACRKARAVVFSSLSFVWAAVEYNVN